MRIAEQVAKEISQLPEALQREVLDFAHFLKYKAGEHELTAPSQAQLSSMENEWDNSDDEVWNDVPTR